MLCRRTLALTTVPPRAAHAAEDAARTVDLSPPERVVETQHGKWFELTSCAL